jgi:uncharacterized protein (DUF2147 family)
MKNRHLSLIKKAFLAMACASVAGLASAQMVPQGLWRNVDDKSGEAKAEIRIASQGGVLSGRIEKALIQSGEPKCGLCTDDRKDQPKLGMEIIRGARKAADDAVWEGGKILDPENGKEYTLRLTPLDGGKQLQVRGYIGPFYRTQVWQRVE